MRSLTAAAAFGAVLLTQGAVEAAEVTVLASTALRPILTELAPRFEGDTSHKLAIKYEAMGALKRQIEAGEPFDVAARHQRPGDARELVGDRDRHDVRRLALDEPQEPRRPP